MTIVHLSKPRPMAQQPAGAVRMALCGVTYALAGSYASEAHGLPQGTSNLQHATCLACLEAELGS